jgi:hypothetical protein
MFCIKCSPLESGSPAVFAAIVQEAKPQLEFRGIKTSSIVMNYQTMDYAKVLLWQHKKDAKILYRIGYWLFSAKLKNTASEAAVTLVELRPWVCGGLRYCFSPAMIKRYAPIGGAVVF